MSRCQSRSPAGAGRTSWEPVFRQGAIEPARMAGSTRFLWTRSRLIGGARSRAASWCRGSLCIDDLICLHIEGATIMPKAKPGLRLSRYQALAMQADNSPDKALAFPLLSLFGETGSLLSVVKKKQRDRAAYVGYAPHVIEELGDVLWYFTVVAVSL